MSAAIETQGLTRRFGRVEAVHQLDLRVPEGAVFALIGPNGAGKTTTIKLLMNLLRPTGGRATVLGVDSCRIGVNELQRIGYVSENQLLPEWLSPAELVGYCRPLYPAWDDALAQRLQKALGLSEKAPLKSLSRGTRMKAALLVSLAYHPDLVVLDEPFSGLDPLVRDELVRALLEAPGERPPTVFVSSHDVDEVERLADWVGFLQNGRLVFAEPVESLLKRFRLVEVVAASDPTPGLPTRSEWIAQGASGRTLRFVDTQHSDPDAESRIAAAFPGATVATTPLALRDIFVTLARSTSRVEAV
jgi:ABC-2 type transport system ATP-binding protein